MEENSTILEPLVKRLEAYGKTSFELNKLKVIGGSSNVISTLFSKGIYGLILFMLMVNLNIGAALWLGELIGNTYHGFFSVAGFYGIVWGVLYFFFRKGIKRRMRNKIISEILD